ncbi:serine O-acetyltransferase [Blochmannia endosymbiont of Polyrhachis (Hedomyrma) turneri]|uniref:serine O-acetyltransferase n=1 Tax=Blochmannia endosymbiont of Polyrhachis (Hedomyrma) turneri TaxID=1505596 RepID=UPI00061A63BD|nr:serine O-acetyltransferase [Blochmannia endosymbiont of Polyrhachis (Hedomyrma) turneri]AKC60155.1 serine acetyltransferase [Blochmannia endosymbiont of Polyrhachis (Hedomyrma) turneri]
MSLEIMEFVWNNIKSEAQILVDSEYMCSQLLWDMLLKHKDLSDVLTCILAYKLCSTIMSFQEMMILIKESYSNDPEIVLCAARDIHAIWLRDPAVDKYCVPVLYFKGFHALQAYRISHWLWKNNRRLLALYFQSRIACIFSVDVHPAASIGSGVIFDHATGIVIGETAIVEDDVSILQFVTLGGRGDKVIGDRHPKIRMGVMIGAGAIILGNIEIGCYAKVGAGSVVLHSVPAYTTVAGNPAKVVVGGKN